MADAGLVDLVMEELLAGQEAQAQNKRDLAAEAQDPFGRHRWVLVHGLQQKADLNGKYAEIVAQANEKDRFGVCVQGEAANMLIKRCNLQPIADQETIEVCRLAASGEESFIGGYIQDTRWPLEILESLHYTTSQVSTSLGFPLRMTRATPRSKLTGRAHFDNQWATFMAIDPVTGLAPGDWQSGVGPVVVWRPDGAVSSDDMCLLNDFLSSLLDHYSDDSFNPSRHLTPEAWGAFKARMLESRSMNPHIDQYEDLNL